MSFSILRLSLIFSFSSFFSLKDYAEKVDSISEDEIWNIIVDLTMVGAALLVIHQLLQAAIYFSKL